MLSTIRKLILVLIITAVITFLGLLGYNVYLNHKKTKIKEQLEKERQEKLEELKKDEELRRQVAELERDRLQGWTPPANSFSVLSVENINHLGMIEHSSLACQKCHSCANCQSDEECFNMQPKLIFNRKTQEYIFNVLDSITKWVNGEKLDNDGYNDNVTPFLKRYNAVLYGAPGTGKTELVNELVHHLYEQFRDPQIIKLAKEVEKLEQELEKVQKEQKKINNKNPNEITLEDKQITAKVDYLARQLTKKQQELEELKEKSFIPPVFKIDGVQLQTGGAVATQPNPEDKLRMIIEKCKI